MCSILFFRTKQTEMREDSFRMFLTADAEAAEYTEQVGQWNVLASMSSCIPRSVFYQFNNDVVALFYHDI